MSRAGNSSNGDLPQAPAVYIYHDERALYQLGSLDIESASLIAATETTWRHYEAFWMKGIFSSYLTGFVEEHASCSTHFLKCLWNIEPRERSSVSLYGLLLILERH